MSLQKIEHGPIKTAQKVVIYGPEGIGKSTLASLFPSPLFLDCEGGTKQLDVARIAVERFEDILTTCHDLPGTDYHTLVIDTADWAEALMIEAMLRRDGHKSIEDYGFGKGYTEAQNQFTQLLGHLTALIERGIHVVVLAHAQIIKFEQPDEAQPYDRWQLKLTKKCTPLLKEWADMVLFLNWDIKVATDSKTKRSRAVGGRDRVLHTVHSATFDAKNRSGLPAMLPLGSPPHLPEEIEAVLHVDQGLSAGALTDMVQKELAATEDTASLSPAAQAFHRCVASKGSHALVDAFLTSRDVIAHGETWRDAPDDYLQKAADYAETFIDALLEYRQSTLMAGEGAQA